MQERFPKWKVCGISRREDIEALNRYRPDFCGFIFAKKSPRYVTKETARKLRTLLNPEIRTVGVFVNAAASEIQEIAEQEIIQMVQLHGSEGENTIREVQQKTGLPVIKAFSIRAKEDLLEAEKSPADYILLDHGSGGTGKTFDWSLLEETRFWRPYFLAGGLSPENIGEAVARCRPYALDVNSTLETDGKKDPEKIRICAECVERARDFESGRAAGIGG